MPITEEADYEVSVTVRLSMRVPFAPIERARPITDEDALDNFYGYGLAKVLDSGEYEYDVSDVKVVKL